MLPPGDKVEFLLRPEAKPRPGKVERRTGHRLEFELIAIKGDAGLKVCDVEGDVVKFEDVHRMERGRSG